MKTNSELLRDFEQTVEVITRARLFAWQATDEAHRLECKKNVAALLDELHDTRQAVYDAMKKVRSSKAKTLKAVQHETR